MKNDKNKNLKYLVKSNNYVGLLFFALVLASLLYILKTEDKVFKDIKPESKFIDVEDIPLVVSDEDVTITELRRYLNIGDDTTYKIYQSMYVTGGLKSDTIDNESLLFMAYRYLMSDNKYNVSRDITCEEAMLANIDSNIIECGGINSHLSEYKVNYAINKQVLKNTIKDLYNINMVEFSDFYTNGNNKCMLIEDEYLCVSSKMVTGGNSNREFIKAFKYKDTIDIVEKYKYVVDGISYKGFNSNEVGEQEYISTFKKINDKYVYIKTEMYLEN